MLFNSRKRIKKEQRLSSSEDKNPKQEYNKAVTHNGSIAHSKDFVKLVLLREIKKEDVGLKPPHYIHTNGYSTSSFVSIQQIILKVNKKVEQSVKSDTISTNIIIHKIIKKSRANLLKKVI
jgi:hypothetical protein